MARQAAAVQCRDAAHIAVASCVGGAGATTLCRLLETRPQEVPLELASGSACHVLVTRATAAGLAAARTAVADVRRQAPRGQLVLVLVEDGAGPTPIAVRARVRTLRPYLDGVVVLPYVARWRYLDEPTLATASRGYRRALDRLADLLPTPKASREDVPA